MSYRNAEREHEARRLADALAGRLFPGTETPPQFPIGIVLGTGWGTSLRFDESICVPLGELLAFTAIPKLAGHERVLESGVIGGRRVIALRGRVHMNEDPCNTELPKKVRLQIELMLQLGVKTLILTCAAGSLDSVRIRPGDLVALSSFVTFGQEIMPLWAGEFCSPEDTLDEPLRDLAVAQANMLTVHTGAYAYIRGPHFEGRWHDKQNLARLGADVVGMSVKPECCVAALYPGVRVLGLAYVSNDEKEEHVHETHVARAQADAAKLGAFLADLITNLS